MSLIRSCLLLVPSLFAGCATDLDSTLLNERTAQLYRESDRWTGAGALGRQDPLPTLDKSTDLETYLRFGLLNNPGLRAAFDRWRAAMESLRGNSVSVWRERFVDALEGKP